MDIKTVMNRAATRVASWFYIDSTTLALRQVTWRPYILVASIVTPIVIAVLGTAIYLAQ